MMNRKKNKIIFACTFVIVLLLDQGSKYLAETYLQAQNSDFGLGLGFSLAHNTGCAWGFFRNSAFFLALAGIVALGIIFWKRHLFNIYQRPIAFSLLLAGTLGNVIDRICYGFVIDFIDIDLQIYRWPTFNIADLVLCISVITLLITNR
ncbi:MAG: signal peptidase II [Puniceicoccales bacterium]|jgi:signal peptidase II|nr:signal peptidase II [Puniceicoccales bacterium]